MLHGIFIVAGLALLTVRLDDLRLRRLPDLHRRRLFFAGGESIDPSKNPCSCSASAPSVTSQYHGDRFFVREAGKLLATPLFFVLVVLEVIDVVFAVDSIPAIFAVTRDPFLVFSSNIFAVLGLRSLYFLLANLMGRFHYLKYGLGLVLSFVGSKMVLSEWWHIPIGWSLGVIVALLAGAIVASWLFPPEGAAGSGAEEQQ
ncbi:MAG: hypothetical protein R2862_12690 [Thermoanaerobaculia bacterium]